MPNVLLCTCTERVECTECGNAACPHCDVNTEGECRECTELTCYLCGHPVETDGMCEACAANDPNEDWDE